ncbi:hypothetical protein AB3S75_043591 [Citrus x aurantiifolia]
MPCSVIKHKPQSLTPLASLASSSARPSRSDDFALNLATFITGSAFGETPELWESSSIGFFLEGARMNLSGNWVIPWRASSWTTGTVEVFRWPSWSVKMWCLG